MKMGMKRLQLALEAQNSCMFASLTGCRPRIHGVSWSHASVPEPGVRNKA